MIIIENFIRHGHVDYANCPTLEIKLQKQVITINGWEQFVNIL